MYQRPQDIDGEEGDGEGDEADGLQPAPQMQVVLSAPQAQPARDGCQGRDKQEAHHVAEQCPLLITRAGVPQPLWSNRRTDRGRSCTWEREAKGDVDRQVEDKLISEAEKRHIIIASKQASKQRDVKMLLLLHLFI